MRLLPISLLALPITVLACGPFFYPAPPTLDRFPERLPVKTMRELFKETHPRPADAATFDQLAELTRAIAAELASGSRPELMRRIDEALARNRAGEYRKRFANCLYDFRDLLVQENAAIPADELTEYTAWRFAAMDWDDGFFRKPPPAESWQFTREQLDVQRRAWEEEFSRTATRLEAEVAKAAPALKPHWLVQAGAWCFKHERFEEAARLFEQVIVQSPKHPRAEIAQLMLARVRMEEWRRAKAGDDRRGEGVSSETNDKGRAADQALTAYITAYPKGRFAPDIPGWRAGLAREQGYLTQAISLFLQQMDFADHPEIVRRAVRECEACLKAMDVSEVEEELANNGPGSVLPLDEIARQPIAALAVVYHFLDAESRRDFDVMLQRFELLMDRDITERYLPPVLRMRRAGREILPALAEAVARRNEHHGGEVWRPKYLAILAWAASESGEHQQAVRLCDLAGPALEESDDLLFVRAVALQRTGELAPAIEAFRRAREKFPQSPLNAETQFRIATCLRDKQEAGLAAVELLRIQTNNSHLARLRNEQQQNEEGAKAEKTPPELHLASENDQWIDTLLQFAPLAEIERGLRVADLEPEIAKRLREILRQRHLARENFAAARRFAEPALTTGEESGRPDWLPRIAPESYYPRELSGLDWQQAVEKLERMSKEAMLAQDSSTRADKLYALAEMWASVRGYLTLPSSEDFGLFNNEFYEGWANRHRNARIAGFPGEKAAEELEVRDELRHAFRYYLEAADAASGTAVAARALWRANDALRRMAELSPWSAARAFETNVAALSRQLHERLKKEYPDSDEAKRLSVWWSFPPSAELRWMPGDITDHEAEVAIAEAFRGGGQDAEVSFFWDEYWEFGRRLQQLATNAGTWDTAKLLDELAAIRREFLPKFAGPRGSWVINHLDDLTLFLHEPGLTPSVRAKYFAARLSDASPGLDDPEMQPWLDYLTFLALTREQGPEDPATGKQIVRPMSERMREFLNKFPRSRKREAALARLAVATVREARGHTGVVSTEWPEAPKLGGYKEVTTQGGEPFDARTVFSTLDAYEQEYPNGRYAAEMRLWRGAVSINISDWNAAIDLLTATLDDGTKRDLHLDAALNLADVFMRLLEKPETRPAIIAALVRNPSARNRLKQFVYSETLGARLRCLEKYLEEMYPR